MKINKHDSHYNKMDIQPVEVSEQILNLNLSTNNIDSVLAYNMCKAVEYIMRCGLKDEQDAKKEIEKAINHLHRGINGEWVGAEKVVQMSCKNCNYYENFLSDAPCDKCTNNDKWEQQEIDCETCKFGYNSLLDEPCSECVLYEKWEKQNER